MDSLLDMDVPCIGDQLQQFICVMQWLSSEIPQFQSLIAPFHNFPETVYDHTRKCTKLAMARVSLDRLDSTDKRTAALEACNRANAKRVTLTLVNRDEAKR